MNPNDDPKDESSDEEEVQNAEQSIADLAGSSPNSKGATAPAPEELSYAKCRRRLIERYGYKEDELDALFKKEQDLVNFYCETVRKGLNRKDTKEVEDELGWDAEDKFDLTPDEKKRLADAKTKKRLAEYAARDQSKLAEDARVTPEELEETNRSIADMLNSLDEDAADDEDETEKS